MSSVTRSFSGCVSIPRRPSWTRGCCGLTNGISGLLLVPPPTPNGEENRAGSTEFCEGRAFLLSLLHSEGFVIV